MPFRKPAPVLKPNLGVQYNVPPIQIPNRGLADCLNVRIVEGDLTNANVGWSPFSPNWTLNGPVTLIDQYFSSSGSQKLLLASTTDLYEWIESGDTIAYLTPRYATGTAACAATTTVTGSGTTWTTNVKAGDRIHFGSSTQRNPTATEQPGGPNAAWYEVASVTNDTTLVLTAAGPNTSGAVNYTIRSVFTNDTDLTWDTDLFHRGLPGPADWWIGTNGVDPVCRWNGTDTQVERMTAFGFTCRTLRRWKNMMVYGNITESGTSKRQSIRNSAFGDPFNVSTLEAAEFVAFDGVDPILTIQSLADSMVLYGARTIALASFIGPPEYIAFRQVITGLGCLSSRTVADFGDSHEFLGPDAQYRFDGVTVLEINYQVMREVIRKQDPGRLNQAQAHFAEETGEVHWIIPLATDPTNTSPARSYVENYLEIVDSQQEAPFTVCDLPATCTGYAERLDNITFDELGVPWSTLHFRFDDRFFKAAYPFNLMGTAAGEVHVLWGANSQDGAPIESWILTGTKPAIDGRVKGCVTRFYPFCHEVPGASYDLDVTVYTADQLAGNLQPQQTLPYDLSHGGDRFVNPYNVGRFYAVRMGTTGVDRVWTCSGWDADIAPVGERD